MSENKLTIIDQVKEVIDKSGVAFEVDITDLFSLAERGKAIKDVNDPNFLTVKKEMQQKRKYVTEYFEDARKEFNRMSKGIIQVQNAFLAEFTPEEDRLIALDKAEKERLVKEARLEALPAKVERLRVAGVEMFDEDILALDDATFELHFAELVRAKAETDRLVAEAKLAEERAVFEAEKAELARKQAEADRIEAARVEERERAAKELQLAKETAEREKKEVEDRRIAEEADRIAREQAEKEAQEADEKYQAFLKENNYNPETDQIQHISTGGTRLYRFVAEFKN